MKISGAGKINGQGKAWWDAADDGSIDSHERPRLLEPMYCSQFTVTGITVVDPPFWAIHPFACDYVLIEDVVFTAPITSPNTDGVDPVLR